MTIFRPNSRYHLTTGIINPDVFTGLGYATFGVGKTRTEIFIFVMDPCGKKASNALLFFKKDTPNE